MKAKKGDEQAKCELIHKFNPLLHSLAYRLNYEDAENELVLSFLQLVNSFDFDRMKNTDDGGIVAYISRSLKNQAIQLSKCRKKSLRHEKPICDYEEDAQFAIMTLNSAEDCHLRLLLEDIKKVLTKTEYEIITLHYVRGYTVQEISEMRSLSRQAVNQCKNRALEKLKKNL